MSGMYCAVALVGGGTGALDKIDGDILVDGDKAFAVVDGVLRTYNLNASSGETESSPFIISPDSNAGTKRWELMTASGNADCDTIEELKEYIGDATTSYIKSGRGQGPWNYTEGDYADLVTADTLSGIYAKHASYDTSVGCWVRNYQELINPVWFGITSGSSYDNYDAMAVCMSLSYILGQAISIPDDIDIGVSGSLTVKTGQAVYGNGKNSIVRQLDDSGVKTFINENYFAASLTDANIRFENFRVMNAGATSTSDNDHCFDLRAIDNLILRNMWLEDCRGHGAYLRGNNESLVENIWCEDIQEQGIAITSGTKATFKHLRGINITLHLLAVELNAEDTLDGLFIDDITFLDSTSAGQAVMITGDGTDKDLITNLMLSNIQSENLVLCNITDGVLNNIIAKSTLTTSPSLTIAYCSNVIVDSIRVTGDGIANNKLKFTDMTDCHIGILDIEGPGVTQESIDLLTLVRCSFGSIHQLNGGSTGLRIRNSSDVHFGSVHLEGSVNYGVYMVPTTTNDNISFSNLVVKDAATGVLLSGDNGSVRIDSGDLTECSTLIDDDVNTGTLYLGDNILVSSGTYDFDVDGGATGGITLSTVQKGKTITKAWYRVETAPTSDGLATIRLDCQADAVGEILAATAFDDAIFTTGYHDALPDGTAANYTTRTTAPNIVKLVIGGAALTSGKIHVFWELSE